MNSLLQPLKLRNLTLKNRIVMAPLTRRRAGEGGVPVEMNALYYAQRASAGLIIAEASQISPQGVGYLNTPGIHTPEQVEGWRKVTAAVHDNGGLIFLQLWHVGRVSHSLLQPDNALPVSASALSGGDYITTPQGKKAMEVARPLRLDEIPGIVDDYRKAARNAMLAGFDGVEIHAANSYLPDQFMHSSSNIRTDTYGGSIENRCRFTLEVTDAICAEIGRERTGIRLSPSNIRYGMDDPDPAGLFGYLISALDKRKLAYLHLVEPMLPLDGHPHMIRQVAAYFRKYFSGTLITAGNYNPETAIAAVDAGYADLVAFGRLFISNPDLPNRIALNAPLNEPDKDTFYTRGPEGYIDYPTLNGALSGR
ncbi:2,4-dienoyl-CoA reductase [Lentimicrobium saccharophilum]|uniref:2,4-dienoyl-CoA reductase n=1 Tax=Lentimicrobium saccharophilum TaxID=1678841 RepID=A0A0S7BVT2_9BACT|nr:alkene reductase [Lentimicrobium saccharophilum]GAP42258.1 2,4-dienoyl-CoA reductase [Lentimicrobium saccharophilum]